jgi:glycine betaine/proline transport system permease protein
MALAMVVIASMIGARGVGEEVLIALGRLNVGQAFEAGVSIVILAIVLDRILQGFGKQREFGHRFMS